VVGCTRGHWVNLREKNGQHSRVTRPSHRTCPDRSARR
jgi:hypothetical protein